jgi:hypothetical protein
MGSWSTSFHPSGPPFEWQLVKRRQSGRLNEKNLTDLMQETQKCKTFFAIGQHFSNLLKTG